MSKQEIDQAKQPKIKIETIFFPEVFVNRDPSIEVEPRIDISIDNKYSYNDENSLLQVQQKIVISETDKNEPLISLTGIAIFKIEPKNKIDGVNLSIEYFATRNAPAIIYPYMREYISYVSMKASIKTIILPVANFHAIADMKEKNEQQNKE